MIIFLIIVVSAFTYVCMGVLMASFWNERLRQQGYGATDRDFYSGLMGMFWIVSWLIPVTGFIFGKGTLKLIKMLTKTGNSIAKFSVSSLMKRDKAA